MEDQDAPQSSREKSSNAVVSVLAALLVIVGMMVASYFYPYPNGKRPDIPGFFVFWLREALIVGVALLFFFIFAVGAIIKAVRRSG